MIAGTICRGGEKDFKGKGGPQTGERIINGETQSISATYIHHATKKFLSIPFIASVDSGM